MKKIAMLISVILCCVLCSCTQYSRGGYEFDAGVTVDINDLDSIFETTPQAGENTPANKDPENDPQQTEPIENTPPNIGENEMVYWTESGTKYHIYRDCQSLKNSENVLSGTLSEAKESKKAECCKYCSNNFSKGK